VKTHRFSAALTIFAVSVCVTHARDLTFEDRVQAQEAIERVYYSHQIGATKAFQEAVPRDVLERKVRTYLKQSAALEAFWHTTVTAEMLERETKRMAGGTRFPERLAEIYAGLGRDSVTVEECLARPALVDRLAHRLFESDPHIHAAARRRAERLREDLLSGAIDPLSNRAGRKVVQLLRGSDEDPVDGDRLLQPEVTTNSVKQTLTPVEFQRRRSALPQRIREAGRISDEGDVFTVPVLLEDTVDEIRAAVFVVPKTSWSEWWAQVSPTLDDRSVRAVATGSVTLPDPFRLASRSEAGIPDDAVIGTQPLTACLPDDTWIQGGIANLPEGRAGHSAIWTGSQMIVWGGYHLTSYLNSGSRYDPATDTWSPISSVGAASARGAHTAVWTGSRMIVWGGYDGSGNISSGGGRYDPSTDTWSSVTTTNAPSPRYGHTAVWTGARMIVWGGTPSPNVYTATGGSYDPVADTWAPTSTAGVPDGRYRHTAVWTGASMVVWGGLNSFLLQSGGRYNPATDSWTSTSLVGAPSARMPFGAVWTGTRMVLWGGGTGSQVGTGGRYDPVADTWTPTSTVGAPSVPLTMIWTGSRVLLWGASDGNNSASYDPASDVWTPTSTIGAPSDRSAPTAVWTGSLMLVWGGSVPSGSGNFLNTGGRYDPVADSWTAMTTFNAPRGRAAHTAVWTGNAMLIWGGLNDMTMLNSGAVYDLVTDTWTTMSTTNAPSPRFSHIAVWTGTEMIVWGGYDWVQYWGSGGRYNPLTDTWATTSMTGAPSPRGSGVGVWTGRRLIVWGGSSGAGALDTGAKYDPATDQWSPTSTVGAPSARSQHVAVWTGSLMVVWGGSVSTTYFATGGRYDPATDTWTPTSTVGAPTGRVSFRPVWTGSTMIVWGGRAASYVNTGGRYDPISDAWTPTATGPSARGQHTAVWTGTRMVIWGGYNNSFRIGNGWNYDPALDTWALIQFTGAPFARDGHTAVWTGNEMIVWGGYNESYLNTGGTYALGAASDLDGDGIRACEGDCDDTNALIHPGAAEQCNGRDDDCDGLADYGIAVPTATPALTAAKSGGAAQLSWSPVAGATGYDVVKGSVGTLRIAGDFTTSTTGCVGDDVAIGTVQDFETPAPGSGLWYVARAVNRCSGDGSYDEDGSSQQGGRDTEIHASAAACP
jgi:N-acetylneuraminic acid mutarotase